MTEVAGPKPHDLACAEIAAWRGRCLDLFAKGERSVSQALEVLRACDPSIKIKHLASQRLNDLVGVTSALTLTGKQRKSLDSALKAWEAVDARRKLFAHGVATPLLDKQGSWHIRFDFIVFPQAELVQWTASRAEANEFESDLTTAFKALSTELGQLKKRSAS